MEQTLRGGTEADVTRYQTVDNVRTQEIVSTKVRLQWNLKEPALMVHLGAEMLAMQLVISLWCMSICGRQSRLPSTHPRSALRRCNAVVCDVCDHFVLHPSVFSGARW